VEVVLGVDFESYFELVAIVKRFFVDVVVIETQILCPINSKKKITIIKIR
jgi:hypothetical protein